MGPPGGNSKTAACNHNGDQIEDVFERQERDFGIDDEGRPSNAPTRESVSRSRARFHYDYDAHGNWVRTVESRAGTDQDFTLCRVDLRTIDYFE